MPRSRPIPVLHDGRPAGQATLLDAYANTRVQRTRATNRPDQAVDPAPAPSPSPLHLRKLRTRPQDNDCCTLPTSPSPTSLLAMPPTPTNCSPPAPPARPRRACSI